MPTATPRENSEMTEKEREEIRKEIVDYYSKTNYMELLQAIFIYEHPENEKERVILEELEAFRDYCDDVCYYELVEKHENEVLERG